MRKLKKFEIRLYLDAWMNNVGMSAYDSGNGEYTLMLAMSDNLSLIDWFKTSDVDYDEDYALKYISELNNDA